MGRRDLLLNFETPLYGTTEDTNFNFGMWIGNKEAYPKIAKLGQLGTGSGSRDLLLNFGTPSISMERLKIETSNFMHR